MLEITPRAATPQPIDGWWQDFTNKGWKQLTGVVATVGSVIPVAGPAIAAGAAGALALDQINHERLQAERAARAEQQRQEFAQASPEAQVAFARTAAKLGVSVPSPLPAPGALGFTGQGAASNPFLDAVRQAQAPPAPGQAPQGQTGGPGLQTGSQGTQTSGPGRGEDLILGMPRQTAYLVGGAFLLLLLSKR